MGEKDNLFYTIGLLFMAALFAVRGISLFGAEITVPRVELTAREAVEDGKFALSPVVAVDIALNGGYKYGAFQGLGFGSGNLEKPCPTGSAAL
jgi:hypothetical protein